VNISSHFCHARTLGSIVPSGVGAKREPFAHLFEPRDPLNDRMVHTMLAGYRLIEQFVCDAVDPFLRVAKINARSAEFLKAHAEARYLLTAMRT